MRIEKLGADAMQEFKDYCKRHKHEVDESFLYDEDLEQFQSNDENPTYIALKEEQLIGTASLIIDEYNRKGKKGRFRIFHSEMDDHQIYVKLLEKIKAHTNGLETVFVFVPVDNEKLSCTFEKLGFEIERYSCLLIRDENDSPEISIPEGYTLRGFVKGVDEQVWCEVRNSAFAKLKGSETPQTPDMVVKMTKAKDYLEGGMLLLFHGDQPVGVVRGTDDNFDGDPIMNIGPVAVVPEYQGNGLGRVLLRAALSYAKEHSYNRTILCVNADNEHAKQLYLKEGFRQIEAVACYNYDLRK